jgi:hypothetical protein
MVVTELVETAALAQQTALQAHQSNAAAVVAVVLTTEQLAKCQELAVLAAAVQAQRLA